MSRAYIDLRFAPNWDLIDSAREFVLGFFSVALSDRALAEHLCLAVHELVENAIKYYRSDEARIRVEVDGDGPIRIAVENHAVSEEISVLLEEVKAISTAADPLAFYRGRIEETLSRGDGRSRIGLARIRCEAQMKLECHVSGGVVRMVALRERCAA